MSVYQIEDTYELPVDVEVLGVYPPAHYVGKKIHGLATLPDGTQQWLIRIDDWDFNWQDDYRYVRPLFLPRGTILKMHYTYDNSAANERNPNVPPRRVVEGNKSTDEMGTLTLLLLPRHPGDLEILKRDYELKFLYKTTAYYEEWVKSNPGAFRTHNFLGESYLKLGRFSLAAGHLEQAISLEPDYADAYHNLGKVLRSQGRHAEAIQHYRRALKQAPYLGELQANLANALATQGDAEQAIQHYRQALAINPGQAKVQNNLGNAYQEAGRLDEASALAWVKHNKGRVVRDEKHPDRPVVEVDVRRMVYGREQNVDDKGLEHLTTFPERKILNLGGSKVTDDGMAILARFNKLEELKFENTKVTDEGVRRLAVLTKLEKLWLHDLPITDASIDALFQMNKLRELYIYDTKVTVKGAKRLQVALPKCRIAHEAFPD